MSGAVSSGTLRPVSLDSNVGAVLLSGATWTALVSVRWT